MPLGIDRIHKSTTAYIKAVSKRNEGDDKEKTLPIAHLGTSMVGHGEDFDANSEYGRSLISRSLPLLDPSKPNESNGRFFPI